MTMSKLYKGFIETKGKASIEKLKNRTTWKTYDEVKNLNGFGGVLADDTILIDIDDSEQSEKLMNIVEELQLNCRVFCTSRGKHFLFKNHTISRNRTHVQLAVGLTADIKVGSKLSYEVMKKGFVNGTLKKVESIRKFPSGCSRSRQPQTLLIWMPGTEGIRHFSIIS